MDKRKQATLGLVNAVNLFMNRLERFRDVLQEEAERVTDAERPTIKDVVDILPKGPKKYRTRPITDITEIIIHHTANNGTVHGIAQAHVTADPSRDKSAWPGIGYHYVIDKDGVIHQTNYDTTVSYHARSVHNPISLGVALIGNFEKTRPTHDQMISLHDLIEYLQATSDRDLKVILHGDVVATACPGKHLRELLKDL